MTTRNTEEILKLMPENKELWKELKEVYDTFETNKEKIEIEITDTGKYKLI